MANSQYSTQSKNFGNVKLGTTLFHTFVFNGTKGIRKVNKKCGCIVENTTSSDINVSWQPKLPSNKTKHLAIKTIEVIYNDLTSETLTLKAMVRVNSH